jgi:hypothetical protein
LSPAVSGVAALGSLAFTSNVDLLFASAVLSTNSLLRIDV